MEIASVGGTPLDQPFVARFYASLDRLSPGERVEVAQWKKNTATGRKTPFPEFRAEEAKIITGGGAFVTEIRRWLGEKVDALFPREES